MPIKVNIEVKELGFNVSEDNGLEPQAEDVEAAPELPESVEYATEADLPVKKKFATTRKSGYVEDEVDVWVNETITTATSFLNAHNEIAYNYNYLVAVHRDLLANQDALIQTAVEDQLPARLEALREELNAEFSNHYDELQKSYQAREDQITEHYSTQLEESSSALTLAQTQVYNPPAPSPEDINTSIPAPNVEEEVFQLPALEPEIASDAPEMNTYNPTTQMLFDEAAIQARHHVEQTQTRMAEVLADSETQAQKKIVEAEEEAGRIIAEARNSIQGYLDEANVAIELKNSTLAEQKEIFERLRLFYDAQIDAINEEEGKVGFSPLLTSGVTVGLTKAELEEAKTDIPETSEEEAEEEDEDVSLLLPPEEVSDPNWEAAYAEAATEKLSTEDSETEDQITD